MGTGLDLGIDKLRLDEEWVNQPRLFLQWSEKAADAARAYDESKRELSLTAAEVANAIRQDPQSYGLEKTTEASVSAAVLLQKEYQHAEKAVVIAKHQKDLIDGAVEALRQRKSALQDLVTLFISGYFAEPRAPKMAKEMMDEAQDRVRRVRGVKVQADDEW